MKFKNKKTGNIYRLLAHAIDSTNQRDGLTVIVYCPDDNEHSVFVREEKEFFYNFEILEPYCGAVDHFIQGVN